MTKSGHIFPVKHGGYLKVADPELMAWLQVHEKALCDDLGGSEVMTSKQKCQVQNALRVMRVLYCLDKYLIENGIFTTEKRKVIPHGFLTSHYLAYVNSLSRILQSLGLKDRYQAGADWDAMIKARYAKKPDRKPEGEKIVEPGPSCKGGE